MDYIFTIKIPFKANDDVEARELAKNIKKLYDESFCYANEEVKLQRIYKNKPPKKVRIENE